MNTDKETYRIKEFVKSHINLATLLCSAAFALFTILIKYLYYVISSEYLKSWGIGSVYLPEVHFNQIYIIFISLLCLVIGVVINNIATNYSDDYLNNTYICECYKAITKKNRKYLNDVDYFYRKRLQNDDAILDNEIQDEIDKTREGIKSIYKEIKSIKNGIVISIIKTVLLLYFIFFLSLVVFTMPEYYSLKDNIQTNYSIASICCVVFLMMMKIRCCFQLSRIRRTIKKNNYTFDKIDEMIKGYKNQDKHGFSFSKLLSDKSICNFILRIIVVYVLLLFILPLSVSFRTGTMKYDTTIIDGNSYVVIYVGKSEVILKKCVVSGSEIRIDEDGFVIKSINGFEFETKIYNSVIIEDID